MSAVPVACWAIPEPSGAWDEGVAAAVPAGRVAPAVPAPAPAAISPLRLRNSGLVELGAPHLRFAGVGEIRIGVPRRTSPSRRNGTFIAQDVKSRVEATKAGESRQGRR